MRNLRLAVALLGTATGLARAQATGPGALADIVGVWQSDTTRGTSALSACGWTPQHGAVVCEQTITTPQGIRHALNFFTFDSGQSRYVFYVLPQPGGVMQPIALGIHDHRWFYGGAQASPDGRYYRTVNDFTAKDSYRWWTESSPDGKTWSATGQGGRSVRVKPD